MSKDHYVAQTYLKHFCISNQTDKTFFISKSNLTNPREVPIKSICYKHNWSNSPYHKNNRVIEDYLKCYEPKWNKCVQFLQDKKFDKSLKMVMSGYIAFLRAFTPTAIRLGENHLVELVAEVYRNGSKREMENDRSKYVDVIESLKKSKGVKIEVDKGIPKALGIDTILDAQKLYAQFPWLVIYNNTKMPFLTSDNPVCLDYESRFIADIFIAITPSIALLIRPIDIKNPASNTLHDSRAEIKPNGVEKFNRLIVQSAEDAVVFNRVEDWVIELVKDYQNWRVEQIIKRIPLEKGVFVMFQQKPMRKKL